MQVVLSRLARTGLLLMLVLALAAPIALAAPATVHLRVEGSSATLFDGSSLGVAPVAIPDVYRLRWPR